MAIALSFTVAIGSTALSYWPLEEVKARLDALAPDGSADDFPLSRIAGIRWKLRVFASVTAILGVLLVAMRRRLLLRMCELSGAALEFLQYVRGEARRQWARESRLDIATLLTVTLVALLVRVAFLGQPMRTDEATTFIEFVSKPLVFGLAYYPAPNNHLFYTALAHASFVVFGGQEWAIRLPALLAGVLVVPAAYVVAGMYYGRVAAPIAAPRVAVSSPLIR